MTSGIHEDETPISDELVRRIVDTQLPQWAGLPLRRLPPVGTDNQLFRLGEDLLVRMPRIHWAADAPAREMEWLPGIAAGVPLEVPAPVALGEPDDGYPFDWCVVPWLEGTTLSGRHLGDDADNVDWQQVAADVGEFLLALRELDATGGPVKPDGTRGSDLATADEWVRTWTDRAGDRVDRAGVLAAWEESLAAPRWEGDPAWLHCDVHEGNLLQRDGRVAAVIDWGGLGVGDPAIELNAAWGFFPDDAVATYRDALGLDEAAWLRGRGWALQPAISGMVYYKRTAPERSELGRRTVERIVADARR
jgi:aminoglycoside phosphotransferase (APT) family kinase protein